MEEAKKKKQPVIIGALVTDVQNYRETIDAFAAKRFEFMCTSLFTKKRGNSMDQVDLEPLPDPIVEPFTVEDLAIPTHELPAGVVGRISNVNELLISDDMRIRKEAMKRLADEMEYCSYLKLLAVLVEVDSSSVFDLAEAVYQNLDKTPCVVWVRVPMVARLEKEKLVNGKVPTRLGSQSGWQLWDKFRNVCSADPQMALALEVSGDIISDQEMSRWLCEPLGCVILLREFFEVGEDGRLMISKERQWMLYRFFPLKVKILIDFDEPFHSEHKEYRDLVHEAFKKWQKSYDGTLETCKDVTTDYPYAYRQPIISKPRASTYERMEKDEAKYKLYEKAVGKALLEMSVRSEDNRITILIPVAGRGRLVESVVNAVQSANIHSQIFAVEKNLPAVSILLKKASQLESKECKIEVIQMDPRLYQPKGKVDMIVFDCLGSCGDDMLAPEFLDAAQLHLKDNGIIIPKSYQSYLVPIMNPTLYQTVRSFPSPGALESMHLVKLQKSHEIDLPQPLFQFKHPNYVPNDTNDRTEELRFYPYIDATLHGFAASFHTDLYDGVTLSTVPTSRTPDLTCLSAFFPLRSPMMLKGGESFRVKFKRCSSEYHIWYEWAVTTQTSIASSHNVEGEYMKLVL